MILIAVRGRGSTVVEHTVIGVGLDMLLQVLRALEVLPAQRAAMRFEWDVDANMGGDVIALHHLRAARPPRTSQAEIVGALATDVFFAKMFLFMRFKFSDFGFPTHP